jgi:acetyltransferase
MPILSVFMGKNRSTEGLQELRRHRVPVYRFPEEAASAMWAMVRYQRLRDAPRGKAVKFRVDRARALRTIRAVRRSGRSELTAGEVHDVLSAYGFPMVASVLVETTAEAIAAAQEVGYPVVLKIESERHSHKTDVGGVKVDVRNGDEVGLAFRDLKTRLGRRDATFTVRVQRMVRGGRELILGMTRDAQFGPLLMFGLGGVFVEVLRDVSIRIHPLTDVDARSMVERVKGYAMLAGVRGDKPVAIPLIEECLLRLSQMVTDLEDQLSELDINPLIVTARPEESFVVDARISLSRV